MQLFVPPSFSNKSLLFVSLFVYGCRSKLVNVVSGVPQGSVFLPDIVPPVHLGAFSFLENKLIGYADDST